MSFIMKVSVPVLMLVVFPTGSCGVLGRFVKKTTEISRMAPMQRVEARRNFWAEVEGRPVQSAPAPAPAPAPVVAPQPAPAPQPVATPVQQAISVQQPAPAPAPAPQPVATPVQQAISVQQPAPAPAPQSVATPVQQAVSVQSYVEQIEALKKELENMKGQNDMLQRELASSRGGSESASSFGGHSSNQSVPFAPRAEGLAFFPQSGDKEYDVLIGSEENTAKGTIRWLVERFYSTTNNKTRKKVLTEFLGSHGCFSVLQSARESNAVELKAESLKMIMDGAGDDKEDKVKAVYEEIARAVEEAAGAAEEKAKGSDVPVVPVSLESN